MFTAFFYKLREAGIPASPTAFLTLQKALSLGLIRNLADFYTASRSILVKSERYFDPFDQVFARHFEGAEMPGSGSIEISTELARMLMDEWLKDPNGLSRMLGIDRSAASRYTPEELLEYFKKILDEQKERHRGGSKWIGTGGTSPLGHSGHHPGGLRIGGRSEGRSAVKTALERRYRDYRHTGPLTQPMIGEALKRLKNLVPVGPKDRIRIDATIYRTVKNAGEIEIVFERSLKNRLRVILAIDNGGWSMDPYTAPVQTLFDYARAQFADLGIFFFHNTVYDSLWKDPGRSRHPTLLEDLARMDRETRLIIVGDASMAPYELLAADGSIYLEERSGIPSIERLRFLSRTFPYSVWLNPVPEERWRFTRTIQIIRSIFPMFELSLDGLEKAVARLMAA